MKWTAMAAAAILTAACAFGHHSFPDDETGLVQRWSVEMGAMLPLSKRGIGRPEDHPSSLCRIRMGEEAGRSAEGMGELLR
jgi:hypothetical protein